VNTWVKRHREQGEGGLLDGRRVSPRRGKGRLTAEETRQVRAWLIERTPDQLELPFALWTSRAVRELIERRLGKRLGLTAVQLYLQRWGLTPQKAPHPRQGAFAGRAPSLAGAGLSGDRQAGQGGAGRDLLG
jgi:transposase